MNDTELLRAWVTGRDETAFAELVRRYVDLVYASARRQVGSSPLLDDIVQAVFLVLARKADSLSPKVILSGWLFQTTRFVAARALLAERRRSHHENASAMNPVVTESPEPPEHWSEVAPHLDAALGTLPDPDRDALVLRFLEGLPLRLVGERLGVTEDAARMRVQRALEKLRILLTGKGVVLTAAGLLSLLGTLPGGAAPEGLAVRVVSGVGSAAPVGISAELAAGATRDLGIARIRRLVPRTVLVLLVGALLVRLVAFLPANQAPSMPLVAVANSTTTLPTNPIPVGGEAAAPPARIGPSKILLQVRSSETRRPLVAQVAIVAWGRGVTLGPPRFDATASNGGLEIPVSDPKLYELRVWVSAPGHVPVVLNWHQHEFVNPVLLHECLLDPGQVLQGTVQDETGLPVPDAVVNVSEMGLWVAKRQNVGFFQKLSRVTTDAQGQFRCDQVPVLKGDHAHLRYTVSHPGFVRARVELESPTCLATNHVVILLPGIAVSGKVLGPDDRPIPNATVEENNHLGDPYRETTTDSEGRFSIGPFAPGSLTLEATSDGLVRQEKEIQVGPTLGEVVLRLTRKNGIQSEFERGVEAAQRVRVFGSVVDAESGQPLPRFQVWLDQRRGSMLGLVGDGTTGRFDWPVEMMFHDTFSLEVSAEGYESTVSDVRPVKDGGQHFEFRMRKGNIANGTVVTEDGHPVAGALVSLQGIGFGLALEGGRAAHQGGGDVPQVVTRSDGGFSLPLKLNSEQVLVVHDSGVGVLPVGRATNVPIVIHPWGSIDGVALTAGQPAANQTILLESSFPENESEPLGIPVSGSTRTDSNGRFHFDSVAPISVVLRRVHERSDATPGPVGVGPAFRVDVPPGTRSTVTLATIGRTIVGRLQLSQPVPGYRWANNLQTLEMLWNDPPNPSPKLDPLNEAERVRSTRLSIRRDQRTRRYFPTIESDGSFRIEDVPAGKYVFKLAMRYPREDFENPYQQKPVEASGSLERSIEIPNGNAGDPPLDLGVITIPILRK